MQKRLDLVVNNHMDLIWRRCFGRRVENDGRVFVSYQEIEEYYIEDNLRLCEQCEEYKFQIESAAVVRAYLARNPQREETLKRLYREGRMRVGGTGDNIVDGNLPGGESLVRNFVIGQLYLKILFGEPARLANRDDAFGNCAQLPQILRGCGMRWVKGLSYTTCPKPYWRGMDGSTVYTQLLPVSGMTGGWRKYAPCPECAGRGTLESGKSCPVCKGRRIDRAKNETERQTVRLQTPLPERSVVMAGGEEIVPDEGLLRWKEQFSESDVTVRFALEVEQYDDLKEKIECETPAPEDVFEGELNPNNTGCYTTRIRTKQLSRATENRLLRLETLGTMEALLGGEWPKDTLQKLWHGHLFTLFHDAVTATHIDAAYQELLDCWSEMDAAFRREEQNVWKSLCEPNVDMYSVVNHTAFEFTGIATIHGGKELEDCTSFVCESGQRYPVLEKRLIADRCECDILVRGIGPFERRVFLRDTAAPETPLVQVVEERRPSGIQAGILQAGSRTSGSAGNDAVSAIENERYRVRLGRQGILEVYDKLLDRTIAECSDGPAVALFLEDDIGSPWASVIPGTQELSTAPYTYLQRIERTEHFERAWYLLDLPQTLYGSINGIQAEYSVTLYRDVPYVEFDIRVDWDAYNTRLRLKINTPVQGAGIYETPYGLQERKPYEPVYRWTGANGDWPAWNFFGVQSDISVALFNRGTPSSRILVREQGSELSVSLLRSPTMPTYLHEPDAYTMLAFDGMRDTGHHRFQIALAGYASPLSGTEVIRDAHNFNAILYGAAGKARIPALPRLESSVAYLSCVKHAENRDGWICRIIECTGKGGTAFVCLPDRFSCAERTDLLEQTVESVAIKNHTVSLTLKPFEICTLCIG